MLSTHHHPDHSQANPELAKRWNAPVYGHKSDAGRLPGFTNGLEEGDTISVGRHDARILFIPAHTRGHIAYVFDGARAVFCGDTLFAGSIGRTDLPGGDYDVLMRSITGVLFPLGDAAIVHPGHGPDTTIGRERTTNPFVLEYLARSRP